MQIQNPEAAQIIRDEAGLTLSEGFPQNLSSTVQGVIDMTPSFHKRIVPYASLSRTTSGAQTIATTSSTKNTYITSLSLGVAKDSACDVAIGAVVVTCNVGGAAKVLAAVPIVTLTAQTANIYYKFDKPILLDKGAAIAFGTSTYTAGTMCRNCTLFGYEE